MLEEILLENSLMVYTKPQYRLAYLIISTGIGLHNARSLIDQMPDEEKKKLLMHYGTQTIQPVDKKPEIPEFNKPNTKPTINYYEAERKKMFESRFSDLFG